jgi:hypothetical protein
MDMQIHASFAAGIVDAGRPDWSRKPRPTTTQAKVMSSHLGLTDGIWRLQASQMISSLLIENAWA